MSDCADTPDFFGNILWEYTPASKLSHFDKLWDEQGFVLTHPARLNDLMVTVETVLNVHQLLKVILKNTTSQEKREGTGG